MSNEGKQRRGMFWNMRNRTAKGGRRRGSRTSVAEVRRVQGKRSPESRVRDAVQTSQDAVDLADPRVEDWKQDPGALDVHGIDDEGHGKPKPKRKST